MMLKYYHLFVSQSVSFYDHIKLSDRIYKVYLMTYNHILCVTAMCDENNSAVVDPFGEMFIEN